MSQTEADRVKGLWAYTFRFGCPGVCTYCGETRKLTVDHVLPVSYLFPRRFKNINNKGITCVACSQCNGFLGNRHFDTFMDRCEFVSARIEKKHRRLARGDVWEKDELATLKGKLRTYVKQQNLRRLSLQERIEWLGSDSFYRNISGLCFEPSLDRGSSTFSSLAYGYFESVLGIARNFSKECAA